MDEGKLLVMGTIGRSSSCYIRESPEAGFQWFGELTVGDIVMFLGDTTDDDCIWLRCLSRLGEGWVPMPYFKPFGEK